MDNYEIKLNNVFKNGKCKFWDNLFKCFNDNYGKKIFIFGAGELGEFVSEILQKNNYNVNCFVDNDSEKWGKEITRNIKCISIKELLNFKKNSIILVTSFYYAEIAKQLVNEGFINVIPVFNINYLKFQYLYKSDYEKIIKKSIEVVKILEDNESKRIFVELIKGYFKDSPVDISYNKICEGNQGFAKGIINLNSEESFVDCGAFNGDTIKEFLKRTNNEFSEIYAFEMDKDNYYDLEKFIDDLSINKKESIFAYNIGLWNESGTIKYNNKSTAASNISEKGKTIACIDQLDTILEGKTVTLIKMDIEGAEMEALNGAEKILKRQNPKLAISIYHNMADLWEIPLYIKKTVPAYKIYIRHHTEIFCDTMCYAVI